MKYGKIAIAAVSLIAAMIFSSCASRDGRYLPVYSSQPRISTLGFSVQPPHGQNWFEKVDQARIVYYKRVPSSTYAIITQATELHFNRPFDSAQTFYSFARSRKQLAANTEQIRNTHVSFHSAGTELSHCLRYRQSYDDYRENTLPESESSRYTAVANTGVICFHPDNPKVGIDLYYQERKAPGNTAASYAAEGESFLHSLSVLELQATR